MLWWHSQDVVLDHFAQVPPVTLELVTMASWCCATAHPYPCISCTGEVAQVIWGEDGLLAASAQCPVQIFAVRRRTRVSPFHGTGATWAAAWRASPAAPGAARSGSVFGRRARDGAPGRDTKKANSSH